MYNDYSNMTPDEFLRSRGINTSPQSSQPAPVKQNSSIFGDVVDAAQMGGLSAFSGIANFFGADDFAQSLSEQSQGQLDTMTNEGREGMQKEIYSSETGFNGDAAGDLDYWLLNIANLAGQMAATAPLGGFGGKAVSMLGNATKVGKAAGAALSKSPMGSMLTGSTVGVGAVGGAAASGMAGTEAQGIIDGMALNDLFGSDKYKDILRTVNDEQPELSDFEKFEAAKSELAKQVNDEVTYDPKLLVANFAGSFLGDNVIAGAFKKRIQSALGQKVAFSSSRAGNAAKGFAAEGSAEAFQGGLEKYTTNVALNPVDGRDAMQGVYAAGINEGILGGVTGGGLAATGRVQAREIAPQENLPPSDNLESVLDTQQNDTLFNPNVAPPVTDVLDAQVKQTGLMQVDGNTSQDWQPNFTLGQNDMPYRGQMQPYVFEGDVDRERVPPNSVPLTNILESPVIEGEFSLPKQLADRSQVIYGEDGRPAQQAKEELDRLNLKANGKPFATEKSLVVSKNYKDTVASGITPEIVKVDGGFAWKLPESQDTTQELLEPTEPTANTELQTETIEAEPTRTEDPVEQNEFDGLPIQETNLNELTLSEDVPQFKDGANDSGVVEALGGSFDRTGVAPIQVWVRNDGRKEVISGRHRLDLARRSGEDTMPTQYHYEKDGFNATKAASLDAILNVRDGQGKVKDYVKYFQANKLTEKEADAAGVLGRATGKRAYAISNRGSDDLIASHSADLITDEAAYRLSEVAPNEPKYQAVGLKAVQEGKSISYAENLIRAVKSMAGDQMGSDTGDMFGFDDSGMVEAENMAKAAASKQRELNTRLSAIRGAAKNPKLAKAEGVDVKDPNSLNKRIEELTTQVKSWSTWHTNPALVSELRQEIGAEALPVTPSNNEQATVTQTEALELTQETEQQRSQRETEQAEVKQQQASEAKTQENKANADNEVDDFRLSGSNQTADIANSFGQNDMFGESNSEVKSEPKGAKEGLTLAQWESEQWESNEHKASYLESANGDLERAQLDAMGVKSRGASAGMYVSELLDLPRDHKLHLEIYDQYANSPDFQNRLTRHFTSLDKDIEDRIQGDIKDRNNSPAEKAKQARIKAIPAEIAELNRLIGKNPTAKINENRTRKVAKLNQELDSLKRAPLSAAESKVQDNPETETTSTLDNAQDLSTGTVDKTGDNLEKLATKLGDKKKAAAAELAALIKSQKGTLNSGFNPEIMLAIAKLGGYTIAEGTVNFAQWARDVLNFTRNAGIPDADVTPHLKESYGAIAYNPEKYKVSDEQADLMDSGRVVSKLNLAETLKESEDNVSTASDSMEQSIQSENKQSESINANEDGASGSRQSIGQSEQSTEQEIRSNSEPSISTNDGSVLGAGSTEQLFSEDGAIRDPSETSDTRIDGRSDSDNGARTSTEQETTAAVDSATKQLTPKTAELKTKGKKSHAVKWGEAEDILSSVPVLMPAQAGDIALIENRFFGKDDPGTGYQNTNGTGTGKTFVGLGMIKRFAQVGKNNVLIVVPNDGIARQWVKAGKDFFGLDLNLIGEKSRIKSSDAGKGITVATYATLGQNNALVNNREKFDLIIPDESQNLMGNQQANSTKALDKLRVLTNHERARYSRSLILHSEEQAALDVKIKEQYLKILSQYDLTTEAERAAKDYYEPQQKAINAKVKVSRDQLDKEGQFDTKVLFLSATPWPYVKNLDYSEGYVFNYDDYGDKFEGGYENSSDGHNNFYIRNFGYQWRYHKLNKPGAEVDQSLMEREFHENLKSKGVIGGRALEVDADYKRDFIKVETAAGEKLDDLIEIWNTHEVEGEGEFPDHPYRELADALQNNFKYHDRIKLVEAIKAEAAVERAQDHLNMGRKVVIFHSYNVGGSFDPVEKVRYEQPALLAEFEAEFPGATNIDFGELRRPLDVFAEAFGDKVKFYNGDVKDKDRLIGKDQFNQDDSGVDVIVVQQDAGEAGISLHDTTGKHQRVLISIGMPVKPTQFIQIEGRVYRVGVKTDAQYENMTTGTAFERQIFASTIAGRASTAENLAMGEFARSLKNNITEGYLDADYKPAQTTIGKGGKFKDRPTEIDEWDKAKTYYYANLKRNSKTKSAEGEDYFATPEPLGKKMVEWAQAIPGTRLLEPSVGHAAIGRWFPGTTRNKAMEQSYKLSSLAAMNFPGDVVNDTFESLNIINKFETVVMNPPFGKGGSLAYAHIRKAIKHLVNGGRIVALVPDGPAANKKLDALLVDEKLSNIYQAAEVDLPQGVFDRAGTGTKTKIIILDRFDDSADAPQSQNLSFTGTNGINELFDSIKDVDVRQRNTPTVKEVDTEQYMSDGRASKIGYAVKLRGPVNGSITKILNDEAVERFGGKPSRDGQKWIFEVEEQRTDFKQFAAQTLSEAEESGVDLKFPEKIEPLAQVDGQSSNDHFEASGDVYTTKRGKEYHVTEMLERHDKDIYNKLKELAKELGGWARGQKFMLPTVEDVAQFNELGATIVNDTGNPSVMYNRTTTPIKGNGVTEKSAKLAFKRFENEFKGLKDAGFEQIITDKKPSEIFGPELTASDDKDIKGAFDKDTNTLFIFSKNHQSIDDIRRTLREELLTHKGLGIFDDKKIGDLLNRINATRDIDNKDIQAIWADIDRNYADKSDVIQAEEFLGKVAQDEISVPAKYWNQILASLRILLRKAGLVKDSISLPEMRTVVSEISTKLKQGSPARNYNHKVNKVGNSGLSFNKSKGKTIKAYHGTGAKFSDFDKGKLGTFTGAKSAQEGFFFTSSKGLAESFRSEAQRLTADIGATEKALNKLSASDIEKLYKETGLEDYSPFEDVGAEQSISNIIVQLEEDLSENSIEDRTGIEKVIKKYIGKASLEKGEVKEVELNITNPLEIDFANQDYTENAINNAINKAKKAGNDSVVFKNMDDAAVRDEKGNGGIISDVYFVFDNKQIDSSNIMFNRSATDENAPFTLDDETKTERFIRFAQDKLNRVKKVQQTIKDAGGTISDKSDVYGKEALYYGKVEEDFRQLAENSIEPIAQALSDGKVDQAELDLYLYALHAPERNAYIKSIDESMEAGSGMTNEEAALIVASVNADPRRKAFEAANTLTRDMIDQRVDKMREHGLIDDDSYAALQSSYTNYVPLKGQANDEGGKSKGTGMGFNIAGRETIAALGRKSKAESPLIHAMADTQAAIVRGNKNEVGNAMLNLINEAPNESVWNSYTTEGPLERKKGADGQIKMVPMSKEKMEGLASNPNKPWFSTKKHGVTHYMKFEDLLIAQQMKSVGVDNGNKITQMLGSVNRFLSTMSTSANPEFLITNMLRDVQTAVFNVAAESEIDDGKLKGLDANKFVKGVMKDYGKSFAGIRKALRDNDTTSEWGQMFDDFRKQGAKTGYFDMKDIETQERDLKKLMLMQDKKSLVKFGEKAFKFMEDYNSTAENAIRLSVYKNAIDSGVSKHTAATLAKNLTVNFNRKGEAGTWLNSLYLFANAGIQGTANFARAIGTFKTVDGKKNLHLAQKAGIAMAGIAFGMAVMNRMIAEDDEDGESFWDKIPDHVKERNVVMMIGPKEYITVPLPYGYNVFANFGTAAESVILGGGKISKNAGFLARAVMGSFLPLGLSEGNDALETSIKTIMPQIGKPLIDLSTNTNFFGGRIYNDNNEIFGDKRSDAGSGYEKTNAFFKSTAMGLNKLTGGSEYQSGVIDVHPETVRYLVEYIGGGAGRTVLMSAESVARGSKGEFDATRTPFSRRAYGQVKDYGDQTAFYDNVDNVETIDAEFKSLRGPVRMEFRAENAGLLRIAGMAKSTKKYLTQMRKQKKNYEERGLKEQAEKLAVLMETRIDRFNKEYNEVMNKR